MNPTFKTLLLVSTILAPSSQLIGQQKSSVDLPKGPGYFCVYVPLEKINLFQTPSDSTPPVWESGWVHSLQIDIERLKTAPPGWLPVRGTGKKRAVTSKGPMPDTWVRRTDVVMEEEFRKVISCWPIKSVVYLGEGCEANVTFETNGSALVTERGDGTESLVPQQQKAHVYMARNLVYIKAPAFYFMAGYRPEERRLFPNGDPAYIQEAFPSSKLIGCQTNPKTTGQ